MGFDSNLEGRCQRCDAWVYATDICDSCVSELESALEEGEDAGN